MKALLHYFLVQNKIVSIPNVGSISIVTKNAADDFVAKKIAPPAYNLLFKEENDAMAEIAFVQYAIHELEVSEAIVKSFLRDLDDEFKTTNRLNIDGIGVIAKENGYYNFQSHDYFQYYFPIEVDRVVHADAVHAVRVGEEEKSSTEMRALLSKEKSKSHWWVYVLVILLFLAGCSYMYYYYFYQK
ncbi:hypothetical protein [Arachidicoccus sp.]|uniref:hypothetical protein n=1 Tax=Arachidicoccus sp. TaxID=1872624 RepID=UPI003D2462F9